MPRLLPRLAFLFALSTASLIAQAQQKLKYPKADPQEIYQEVEKPAIPAGGVETYAQYLAEHQQYPTQALQAGKQGTVPVSFVIERTGSISQVKVENPLDPALDAEAIRLISAAPRWTPAQHKGQKVRQRVTVPVTFQIPADATGAAAPTPNPNGSPITVKADSPARPVGGTDAFFEWVQQNQRYPALARQRKIQGRVMVEFLIQPDGSLTDVKVPKRLGSGLDEEAIRLIKAAPKWDPARFQGKPVRQKMVLPIVFQL
ncbi:energy transducer TonB [Hymenobacter sp. NBH84]|uniref:energy transducer TonB n=1 Tax=Hymenobacter sp. NBH84 TaxID=2596915 RepID=UPI0016265637|nr:energy transducer TonB [Hymenobacter sp. NBH84]